MRGIYPLVVGEWGDEGDEGNKMFSLLPVAYSLFPVPCSLIYYRV